MTARNATSAMDERSRRIRGERMALRSAGRLFCIVSVLRTLLTQLLPSAGAAVWWSGAVSLLPGAALYVIACVLLRKTRQGSVTELARYALGCPGAWAASAILGALCFLEAAASLTALVTFFTEGLGTRGTQLTMAILTSCVILLTLHREGLPRAIWLMRYVIGGACILSAAMLAGSVRWDHLFPLYGEGPKVTAAGVLRVLSAGWPLVLLASGDRGTKRCAYEVSVPILTVAAAMIVICLMIPHELLLEQTTLADALMLPSRFAAPGVRTLLQCLTMLLLFLGTALSIHFSSAALCAPMKCQIAWLPAALLVLATAAQALDIAALWRVLTALLRYAIIPVGLLLAVCMLQAVRRKKV